MRLTVQDVSGDGDVPDPAEIDRWVRAALGAADDRELNIRIVNEPEMAELNSRYRHKEGPTNVLSFPFESPPGVNSAILGDIVICAPVVRREAGEQGKALAAHWAHMVVHGIMHLRGYAHENEADAERMEAAETEILTGLGFPAPYARG
ncbi:MAG: rRNA maturation RNase YbeY [Acidiferrobacteraceae bacterium]